MALILGLNGWLWCGATGMPATEKSVTPGYQVIYDAAQDRQYCALSGDIMRVLADGVEFQAVPAMVRSHAIPIPPTNECPS